MRFRLTGTAKVLIVVVIIAILGGLTFAGLKSGLITNDTKETAQKVKDNVDDIKEKVVDSDQASEYAAGDEDAVINMDKDDDATINLSLDEWIG